MKYAITILDTSTNILYYLTNIDDLSSESTSVITEYPTTSGKKISDHFYVQPKTLQFSFQYGHFTSTAPISALSSTSKTVEAVNLTSAKELIRSWQQQGTRLNITTYEEYIENLVIDSVKSQESTNIGVWNVTLSLTEVRVAEVITVQLTFDENGEAALSSLEIPKGIDNTKTYSQGTIGQTTFPSSINEQLATSSIQNLNGIDTATAAYYEYLERRLG